MWGALMSMSALASYSNHGDRGRPAQARRTPMMFSHEAAGKRTCMMQRRSLVCECRSIHTGGSEASKGEHPRCMQVQDVGGSTRRYTCVSACIQHGRIADEITEGIKYLNYPKTAICVFGTTGSLPLVRADALIYKQRPADWNRGASWGPSSSKVPLVL